MFDQIDRKISVDDHRHEDLLKELVPVFQCPSDPADNLLDLNEDVHGPHPPAPFLHDPTKPHEEHWIARSNYSGVFGSNEIEDSPLDGNGIFYGNSHLHLRDIVDGLSNTILIGERRNDFGHLAWAGVFPDVDEPFARVVGSADHAPNDPNGHFDDFRSFHPQGANFTFADGSVVGYNAARILRGLQQGRLTGLDTIETGAAIGVLMDSGGMQWGDAAAMKKLVADVGKGTELGKVIGNGCAATGKHTKHHRVPVVRGQAIPAWDPRPLKATGVTYASSAMGADHTAGLVVNPGLPPDQFALVSQEVQLVNAVCDSSGFCQFIQPTLDDIREYYGHFVGRDISREEIADQGWQVLMDEWEFNRRAGFTAADDVLPQCMKEDAIGPNKVVFDVSPEIIADAKVRKAGRDKLYTTKAAG